MTAKDVSVGLTYLVKVSDVEVPVTLTRECQYGGWYGTNLKTGHTVRIATAGRLRKQLDGENARTEARKQELADTIVHTVKENHMPTSTPAAKAKRAARRANKPVVPAAAPVKTESVLEMARRVDAMLNNNVVTPTPKEATVPAKPKRKPVAKKRPTTLRIVNRKVKHEPVLIDLLFAGETTNKAKFIHTGEQETPFITSFYIARELWAQMDVGVTLDVTFDPYVPSGKQAPMPKSKIRYQGPDEINTLYIDRALGEAAGFRNDSTVIMHIAVTAEGEALSLAISVA
jgi:hypothetical protein